MDACLQVSMYEVGSAAAGTWPRRQPRFGYTSPALLLARGEDPEVASGRTLKPHPRQRAWSDRAASARVQCFGLVPSNSGHPYSAFWGALGDGSVGDASGDIPDLLVRLVHFHGRGISSTEEMNWLALQAPSCYRLLDLWCVAIVYVLSWSTKCYICALRFYT